MNFTLALELLKLSIETFKDERHGRFTKRYAELQKEYMEEMSKPDGWRSDLQLDRLLFESETLAKLVLLESSKK